MIICGKCGQPLNQGDSICFKCGTQTAQEPPVYGYSTEQQPPHNYDYPPAQQPPQGYNYPPPQGPPSNVSYVPPPPQYGYAPPPGQAPPNVGYGAPPPQYVYAPPPPQYGYSAGGSNAPGAYGKKPKSKVAAGLLAILIGYGVYNFYLKYYAKAIAQLVISIAAIAMTIFWTMGYIDDMVSWAMSTTSGYYPSPMPEIFSPLYIIGVLLSTGVGIWHLIEGILIFCGKIDRDGEGNPIA